MGDDDHQAAGWCALANRPPDGGHGRSIGGSIQTSTGIAACPLRAAVAACHGALDDRRAVEEAGLVTDGDGALHLVEREDLVAHEHPELVAQVASEHLRAVGADGESNLVIDEGTDDPADFGYASQHAGAEVRAGAHLEHRSALAQHLQHGRILGAADSMADAIRLERLERVAHLVGTARLPGVDREAQPGSPAGGVDLGVLGETEAVDDRSGDVDPNDAAALPGDRLGRDDLVQLPAEATVEAEDQAGPDLGVLEHGAIHAAHRRGDDVVEILLAAAVALHRIEAQLELGHVVLSIGAADHLVHAALDRDRARLDQLGPMEEVEIGLEGPAATPGGDELAKRPVVLRRQADPLRVRNAPHDGGRHRRSEVHVELAQRGAGIKALARHLAPLLACSAECNARARC